MVMIPKTPLAQAQAARQKTLNDIQRRGGVANTPGLKTQLATQSAQVNSLRVPKTPVAGAVNPGAQAGAGGGSVGAGVAGGTGTAPAANNAAALAQGAAQRNSLIAQIQRRGGEAKAPGLTAQLRALEAKQRLLRNPAAPVTTTPDPGTAQPPGGPERAPPLEAPPGTPGLDGNNGNEGVFPGANIFEPENFEGSPLYQFQKQQGEQALARSLAKRGLSNSGHAIEEELNLPLRLSAQDTERMMGLANNNADRLMNLQQNEALRLERAGNNQWSRGMDIAELMSRQSPWAGALAGLNNSADITTAAGQAQANFLRDNYRRSVGSGGGRGGGGGGASGVPITIPGGPDYSNISPAQIGGSYGSNQGWLNLLTQGLQGLF